MKNLIVFIFILVGFGLKAQNSALQSDVIDAYNEIVIYIIIGDNPDGIFLDDISVNNSLQNSSNIYTTNGINKYQVTFTDNGTKYMLTKVNEITEGEIVGLKELSQIKVVEMCLSNYNTRNLIAEADSLNIMADFKLDVLNEMKIPTQFQIDYMDAW